jgi:hypothetical protein
MVEMDPRTGGGGAGYLPFQLTAVVLGLSGPAAGGLRFLWCKEVDTNGDCVSQSQPTNLVVNASAPLTLVVAPACGTTQSYYYAPLPQSMVPYVVNTRMYFVVCGQAGSSVSMMACGSQPTTSWLGAQLVGYLVSADATNFFSASATPCMMLIGDLQASILNTRIGLCIIHRR